MPTVGAEAFKRVVLVGLGDKDPNAREVGAAIAGAVKGLKGWVLSAAECFCFGADTMSSRAGYTATSLPCLQGGSVGLTRAEGVDPQAIGLHCTVQHMRTRLRLVQALMEGLLLGLHVRALERE